MQRLKYTDHQIVRRFNAKYQEFIVTQKFYLHTLKLQEERRSLHPSQVQEYKLLNQAKIQGICYAEQRCQKLTQDG